MAEPLTLGHVASNPLPKLRVSDESQPLEFGAFWHLGLDGLRLHQGLDGLCARTHCLCIVGLHLLQAFLVVLLGKAHVPQELGVNPLKRFVSLRPWFLDAISVPFAGLVVCGVVLGLGHVCTVTRGSRSAWVWQQNSGVLLMQLNVLAFPFEGLYSFFNLRILICLALLFFLRPP